MPTFAWSIEEIITAHPELFMEHSVAMAVALMKKHGRSSCEFEVECSGEALSAIGNEFRARVSWNELTESKADRMIRTEQRKPIVERAAVALAALLFAKLIPDCRLRVTQHGDKADFWLPDLHCALEVSGTEHGKDLQRRCHDKRAQVLANPLGWNGFVVVCCFDRRRPKIHWSHHRQEQTEHE
ncbi:MAG: hypothetical protein L0215_10205 [Gemmataceae bacterium]|nr:hypothetical protein [Gemmataceae bacterium]